MFIELKNAEDNQCIWVNINNISVVYTEARIIIVNGNQGLNNGIVHITYESMRRLLAEIE